MLKLGPSESPRFVEKHQENVDIEDTLINGRQTQSILSEFILVSWHLEGSWDTDSSDEPTLLKKDGLVIEKNNDGLCESLPRVSWNPATRKQGTRNHPRRGKSRLAEPLA
jgi:hypothetical protein